ncbi:MULTISPECIES: 2,3-bisphosphoglycerate-independent phosphoglycerate mutase [unclassified Sinorhizobium]|uniref:2,3-bisphosphoglycerate-independent phosphoglycerate mutase n=1 Tax=unclassified Sinorhizobium TaxID=2613772 RepID=UPI0024C3A75C|nr:MULTISPECIES: 2,3-bisphosphoglycerate-independent phosphoglycerate mutase [unclassified Sinorhizobium]MDK1374633.1 2,3-bisphosphoglycerate-independent phosphoglycerate mutase [Sinorhizobium sp. 6-70]MDK1481968.1 2,3-bisphosphoglycerate-independent phosphoglycerate mutase [Sinorhizobium sp. 6-117]
MAKKKPTVLMIMDGWGWREEAEGNAVLLANTPNFDRLWATCPHAFLTTHGPAVGLPEGQMGNSEVGHLNIGAGRIVMQELPRIDAAIADGTLRDLLAESGLPDALRRTGGACHILGLVSPGGVHSHMDHVAAAARELASLGVRPVIHAFTDGRDTQPGQAAPYLRQLAWKLPDSAVVATVSGRFFAMDRDSRWDRVRLAYEAIALGKGVRAGTAEQAIALAAAEEKTDEFIPPSVVGDYAGIRDGDAVLCANFRSDRVREILAALTLPDFDGFDRGRRPDLSISVGMVSYGSELDASMGTLFPPQRLDEGLSETVAKAGKTQIHLAETEKYPHVTYFLNGGREAPHEGEERTLVPSPKVATYDLQPTMSAPELTTKVVAAIESGDYDLVVVNFANPDMVGHTGKLDAAILAVEMVDGALGEIDATVARAGGSMLVIADHGNCEMMIDPENGEPHTAHTTNPVPVLLSGSSSDVRLRDGILADVAPTTLTLMGIRQPEAMTGRALFSDR